MIETLASNQPGAVFPVTTSSIPPSWGGPLRRVLLLVAFAAAAALLLAVLARFSGLMPVNRGYGWDGEQYARMMEAGFSSGTPSMRLRPVILLINDAIDDHFIHDPLATFRLMNLVYAGVLAMGLAALCRRYGATPGMTAALIGNLFLCVSVAKMFAFYPALVDLGAYAVLTLSVGTIVWGRRLPIVLTSVVAVLSREFGAVVVLFGAIRDRRLGRPLPTIAATYAPAVAAFFVIRRLAAAYSTDAQANEPVLSLTGVVAALLRNTGWWSDPLYVLFTVYFVATLFGGVSLLILAMTGQLARHLREEPEWLAIVLPLIGAGALGPFDMWRYAAFMIPAVPIFWAWCVADLPPPRRWLVVAAVTIATLVTQRPWHPMGLDNSYFRDWFPYYLVVNDPVFGRSLLWPVWRVYIPLALALFAGIAMLTRRAHAPRIRPSARPPVAE
jgi:hypothetical protein